MGKTAEFLAAYTTKNYGVPLCAKCAAERKTEESKGVAENAGKGNEKDEAAEGNN